MEVEEELGCDARTRVILDWVVTWELNPDIRGKTQEGLKRHLEEMNW